MVILGLPYINRVSKNLYLNYVLLLQRDNMHFLCDICKSVG